MTLQNIQQTNKQKMPLSLLLWLCHFRKGCIYFIYRGNVLFKAHQQDMTLVYKC